MKTGAENKTLTEPQKKLWTIGRIICGVLAVIGFAAGARLAYEVIAQPFMGPRVLHMLLLTAASAVCINASITIPQNYFIRRRRHKLLAGAGKWAVTLILPLFLTSAVNAIADNRAKDIAVAQLSPVIDFIDGQFRKNGQYPADILEQVRNIKGLNDVTYIFGDNHFIIQTRAGAIDIDGSAIYYISSDKTWRQKHNDALESQASEEAKHYHEAVGQKTKMLYRADYATGHWKLSEH